MSETKKQPWWKFGWWFAEEDTPEERRLLTKIDLLIVPYSILAYWTMFFDQTNLNNAYVSGLQQDLGFYGNQLVDLQTLYNLGATLGQIPFAYIFTRWPMQWVIPFLNVAWGIFTLLQYRATTYPELAAYRFFVGLFEAVYFPGVHYVLGAWYKGSEIGRRGGMFYCGLPLGVLTASFIQAAASSNLDGKNGLPGWRWMYIICGVITIPLGIVGYFVLPGTPDKPNTIVMTKNDVQVAKDRLARAGHGVNEEFKWSNLKIAYRNWKIWAFIAIDVLFWNAGVIVASGNFLLYLQSLDRYSTSKLNALSAIPPALGIVFVLFVCFSSDMFLGPAWAIVMSQSINIIGIIIIIIWNVPESALWFAFCTNYFAIAMSSALYGWVNTQIKVNPVERSITLITINIISQSTTAWTPLIFFKTVQAPRYPKGYPFILACAMALIIGTLTMKFFIAREDRRKIGSEESLQEDTETVQEFVKEKA